MLQVKNVTFVHQKDLRVLLKDFQLVLNPKDKAVIIGEEGNGKSTLALQFAGYTAKTLRSKTLYVTSEEPFSYTLQEKLKRLQSSL